MTYPTLKLLTTSSQWQEDIDGVTWTDIGDDRIRSVVIRRGRATELDTFDAGTLTVEIEDFDRTYDPSENVLKAGTPVQFGVDVGLGTYPLFTGYADSWDPSEHPSDKDAVTILTATDLTKILARTQLRGYASAVLRDAPAAYFRLDELSGTTMYDASVYGRDGVYVGTSFIAASLVAGGDGGRTWVDDTDYGLQSTFNFIDALNTEGILPMADMSVEFWVKFPTNPTAAAPIALFGNNGKRMQVAFYPTSGSYGSPQCQVLWINNGLLWGSVFPFPFDGQTHHVVAQIATGTVYPTAYIDGVATSSVATLAITSTQDGKSASEAFIGGFGTPSDAVVDEVAVYNSLLSADQVQRHYLAGTYFAQEDSGDRIARVLSMIGLDMTYGTKGGSLTQTVGVNDSDVTALDALRQVEEAEGAPMFITPWGQLYFLGRYPDAPVLTIDDDDPNVSFVSLPRVFNEAFLVNEVEVTWNENAPPVLVRDVDSIAQHGRVSKSITALLASRSAATDLANRYMVLYANPVVRIESCEIIIAAGYRQVEPLWEDAISVDIGDIVRVIRTPTDQGSQIDVLCRVEGVKHTITPTLWTMALNLSPAPLIDWWEVGSSIGLGLFRIG